MILTIATCQFPTSEDINRNCNYILKQMTNARTGGAQLAHFPEACLPGYVGHDLDSYKNLDWHLLESCTRGDH